MGPVVGRMITDGCAVGDAVEDAVAGRSAAVADKVRDMDSEAVAVADADEESVADCWEDRVADRVAD